ncbi:MAG TPA: glycosyltransferase, partial [Polyangiaceae bacterium]|nr:glycosyltransferase [Polyangiaceae bacterium]
MQASAQKQEEYERGAYDAASAATSPWAVMVLAHNEERRIKACLDSIFDGEPGRGVDVYVMANGCTDRTEQIVREYRERRPTVHLVSIQLGDKCNAWNVFIHETVARFCPGRAVYYFMDGDAQLVPGSLTALAAGLERNPHAHASSAPPASGRSMEHDRRELLEGRHLVANLYALRGEFVTRLQREGVRLPLKLEGDDGLLGMLVKWDLRPEAGRADDQRIEPCADAGFKFESVDWRETREWRGYWKRLVRYGRRRFEFQLLGPRLKAQGMSALPRVISEIYGDTPRLKLQWEGFQTLPNWF